MRTGVKLLAIVGTIWFAITVIYAIIGIASVPNNLSIGGGARSGAYGVFGVFLVFAVVELVIHALLYLGVRDRSSTMFLPWLIVTMIELVLLAIVIVAGTITAIYYTGIINM